MLHAAAVAHWGAAREYAFALRAVVGALPGSYAAFQDQLSARLARQHPELSGPLCMVQTLMP
eukprot:218836-Pyramimonas_sp.AAC.2